MESWKRTGVVATIVIVLLIPLYALLKINNDKPEKKEEKAEFIGSDKCALCHNVEYNEWKESDHMKAMQIASDSSVLGDFNNSQFVSANKKVSYFYKRDGKFFVKTEGIKGREEEYEITHTFGYYPLQQYLVPMDDGKYQCLPIAWNSQKGEWYSLPDVLYKDEKLTPTNWLYWTNGGQNWNGMCSECHSTNLKKNYDHKTRKFNTTYSEINIGCEACHGPGSIHEAWAKQPEMFRSKIINDGLPVKTKGINNKKYVELCTRCHSRRSLLGNYVHDKGDLLNSLIPQLLTEAYYPDGQILDEDYVYGSFIQSKMYENEVQCNDCHNVHTGKTVLEGNALCGQCHRKDIYDTKEHHFHKYKGEKGIPIKLKNKQIEVGEGALCINCHMPGKYYMGIDFRHDHSIRIPRPDLTISINTPNACNNCHQDKSAKWADEYITKWYGIKRKAHYGTTFAAARKEIPSAEYELIKIINNTLLPVNVRATAVSYLSKYSSDDVAKTIKTELNDNESIIRETAIRVYSSNNLNEYKSDLLPLLQDSVKAVRAEAAIRLSEIPISEIPEKFKNHFFNALEEYKKINQYMADFPSGRMNLGVMYTNQKELRKAVEEYKAAIEIDSLFVPAKVNLAIAYNKLGKNREAEELLRDLIKNHEELSDAYYYLGLLLAEEKNYSEAVIYLKKASILLPELARINYNTALILQHLGEKKEAEYEFKKALKKEPGNYDFLFALADFYIKNGKLDKALQIGRKLKQLFPNESTGQKIIDYASSQMKQSSYKK